MKILLFRRVLFICLLALPLIGFAQRNKHYKWEAGVDLGASNFLGDLGGANQIGTHFVRDLELSLTRPSFGVHLRYRKSRYVGFRANFVYGKIYGDDNLTLERYRNNRNLNFKSNIFEFSGQVEFYFSKERPGHIYNYKKIHGWRHIDIQEYGFLGVGGFYFNPKGFDQGQWYNLRDMRTEGEGLKPGLPMYSNYSVCFPMGLGFKYAMNRRFSLGIEFGLRLTLTDYIDDVSTVYVDPALLTSYFGSNATTAIHFANPTNHTITAGDNGGIDPTGVGQQRGDSKHNDAYMFMHITVNYKLGKIKKTHSKF
ncbi:MAG: hypothetical protein HY064_11745 [Bacteroidetes bacterium]|nr:hypothetical protein [Bacteroidota bacterium]